MDLFYAMVTMIFSFGGATMFILAREWIGGILLLIVGLLMALMVVVMFPESTYEEAPECPPTP